MANTTKQNTVLYKLNLTNNSDKDFKLLQIINFNNILILDIRQTNRGRTTRHGISMLINEVNWFKNALSAIDNKIYVLEYGMRTTKIDKSLDNILITQIKSDGTIKKILLENLEKLKLIDHINEIEDRMISYALEKEIPIGFSEFNYVNSYVI